MLQVAILPEVALFCAPLTSSVQDTSCEKSAAITTALVTCSVFSLTSLRHEEV